MHIIHKDAKSANIPLDNEYTTKVSDFGVSILLPLDQTRLSTLVQGTFGYIDPEYFHSGLLTNKNDVYNFGVVLVELLTGEKVISMDRPKKHTSLATYFNSLLEEDWLNQVLENRVAKEGDAEQIRGVAKLAKKCLRLKWDKRPSMKEVKKELEALGNSVKKRVKTGSDLEENELLMSEPFNLYDSGRSTGFDSLRSQVVLQMDDGQ
ncbi:hypothetical protein CsSME_00014706 [Camellia sinensis var. sinensis]